MVLRGLKGKGERKWREERRRGEERGERREENNEFKSRGKLVVGCVTGNFCGLPTLASIHPLKQAEEEEQGQDGESRM